MEGDISEMLRQVMGNPQFGAMVQAVKAQMGGEGEEVPDLSKIMDKMPELLAVLGPMMEGMGQQGAEQRKEPETSAASAKQRDSSENGRDTDKDPRKPPEAMAEQTDEKTEISGLPPVMQQFFRPGSREKRNKLLAALKPYLSPARCTLIDRAMSAMQMGELLGTVIPQDHSR